MSLWLAGVGVSRGVAIGAVHRVHGTDLDIPEYHVDPESLDAEVEPRARLGRGEQRVDEAEELHHALVLPQVLVPLEQEDVLHPVRAHDGEPARPLLRRHHLDRRREPLDRDHLAVGAVRARHGELEV